MHKDIPYLTDMGELWGIFTDFFKEKIPWDIKHGNFEGINSKHMLKIKFIIISCTN